jgi:hypothetical protein
MLIASPGCSQKQLFSEPVAGELLFRQPVPTENALRPEGQQFTFYPLPTRNEAGTKPPTELPETPSSISVCYHYDSGAVETLPDSRHEEATGRELIAVLRQLQPEVGRFLAKRHGVLRQLYRSSTKQRTARLPTLKPGRNDPCPCGSGKKFKRCCGHDKRGQMARGVTA